jgi:hypothetical protein
VSWRVTSDGRTEWRYQSGEGRYSWSKCRRYCHVERKYFFCPRKFTIRTAHLLSYPRFAPYQLVPAGMNAADVSDGAPTLERLIFVGLKTASWRYCAYDLPDTFSITFPSRAYPIFEYTGLVKGPKTGGRLPKLEKNSDQTTDSLISRLSKPGQRSMYSPSQSHPDV